MFLAAARCNGAEPCPARLCAHRFEGARLTVLRSLRAELSWVLPGLVAGATSSRAGSERQCLRRDCPVEAGGREELRTCEGETLAHADRGPGLFCEEDNGKCPVCHPALGFVECKRTELH